VGSLFGLSIALLLWPLWGKAKAIVRDRERRRPAGGLT
jgi:hypothetical protein